MILITPYSFCINNRPVYKLIFSWIYGRSQPSLSHLLYTLYLLLFIFLFTKDLVVIYDLYPHNTCLFYYKDWLAIAQYMMYYFLWKGTYSSLHFYQYIDKSLFIDLYLLIHYYIWLVTIYKSSLWVTYLYFDPKSLIEGLIKCHRYPRIKGY